MENLKGQYVIFCENEHYVAFPNSFYSEKGMADFQNLIVPSRNKAINYLEVPNSSLLKLPQVGELKGVSYTDLSKIGENGCFNDVTFPFFRFKNRFGIYHALGVNAKLSGNEFNYKRVTKDILKRTPNLDNSEEFTQSVKNLARFVKQDWLITREGKLWAATRSDCPEGIGYLHGQSVNMIEKSRIPSFDSRGDEYGVQFVGGIFSFLPRIKSETDRYKIDMKTLTQSLSNLSEEFTDANRLPGLISILLTDPQISRQSLMSAINEFYPKHNNRVIPFLLN